MAEYTFEAAMARLEQIVRSLEDGKISLDESLKVFEEGVALVKLCNGKLDTAEQKVRILMAGENGSVTEAPYENAEGKV